MRGSSIIADVGTKPESPLFGGVQTTETLFGGGRLELFRGPRAGQGP